MNSRFLYDVCLNHVCNIWYCWIGFIIENNNFQSRNFIVVQNLHWRSISYGIQFFFSWIKNFLLIVLTDHQNSWLGRALRKLLLLLASILAMHSFLKKSKKLKIEYCKETFDFTLVVVSQYMLGHQYFEYWFKFKPNEKINPSIYYHCNLHGTKIYKIWKIKMIDFKKIQHFFFAHFFLSSKNVLAVYTTHAPNNMTHNYCLSRQFAYMSFLSPRKHSAMFLLLLFASGIERWWWWCFIFAEPSL